MPLVLVTTTSSGISSRGVWITCGVIPLLPVERSTQQIMDLLCATDFPIVTYRGK